MCLFCMQLPNFRTIFFIQRNKILYYDYKDKYPIGSRWKTRNGKSITIIEHNWIHLSSAIVGVVYQNNKLLCWSASGRYLVYSDEENPYDLIKRID